MADADDGTEKQDLYRLRLIHQTCGRTRKQGQKESLLILRRIRDWRAQDIEASLRGAFAEAPCGIPLDVLASYLAGAQIALVQWWLERRQPCTPEDLAQSFHRLQRAAIRDAFGLREDK